VSGLDLAEIVERKVVDELQRMNGRLEQLVADAVDRELGAIVRQLVEQNLNGAGDPNGEHGEHELRDTPEPAAPATTPATKTCLTCGEEKSLDQFRPRRGSCKRCAEESRRRRRAAAREPARSPFDGSGDGSPSTPSPPEATAAASSSAPSTG
jgi:hypothetical protein